MSLLNDVLSDLAAQQQKSRLPNGDQAPDTLPKAGLIKPSNNPWLTSLVVFSCVIIVSVLGKFIWQGQFALYATDEAINEKMVAAATQPAVVAAKNAAAPVKLTSEIPLAISSAGSDGDTATQGAGKFLEDSKFVKSLQQNTNVGKGLSAQQLQIQQLLARAQQALRRDRLTSPLEDNAYSYYLQILSLDETNAQAQQGLTILADRYLHLARAGLAAGNMSRAKTLVHRAGLVSPGYPPLKIFTQQLEATLASAVAAKVNLEAESAKGNPVGDGSQNTYAIPSAKAQSQPAEALPSLDAQQQLEVVPNVHWQDQQQVAKAQQLIAQGNTPAAIQLLQDYRQQQPEAVESSKWLLELYCRQGQTLQAQQLLQDADFLQPGVRQYFAARLAVLAQDEPGAIKLLEQQLNAQGVDENYRSLLAGLYQKQGSYAKAAAAYQTLLAEYGEKPGLLLGYALALDALAQKTAALQAYKRLTQYRDLQTEVRNYIEQRIAALSS